MRQFGILHPVHRPSLSKQICYWVLALALFAARSADAHIHMCLDGQEPPVSVHVTDDGVHHDDAPGLQAHNDKDVKIVSDAGTKKSEASDTLVFAALWSLVDRIPFFSADPPQDTALAPARAVRSHLRPPLRGPPA